MREELSVTTERVDDIPLLLAHSDKMGVPELLDAYFKPHGNWAGMSLGSPTAIWLAHILSEGDHRMNQGDNSGRGQEEHAEGKPGLGEFSVRLDLRRCVGIKGLTRSARKEEYLAR